MIPKPCPNCQNCIPAATTIAAAIGIPVSCQSCAQRISLSTSWRHGILLLVVAAFVLGAFFSVKMRSFWPYLIVPATISLALAFVAMHAVPREATTSTRQSIAAWLGLVVFLSWLLFLSRSVA